MKAAVCYAFGQPLVVEDVDIESPGAGEVRVQLAATAVCHSDVHLIHGDWAGALPVIAGHESAGVVAARSRAGLARAQTHWQPRRRHATAARRPVAIPIQPLEQQRIRGKLTPRDHSIRVHIEPRKLPAELVALAMFPSA